MATISTHNGSQVARDHNVRNIKVVSKEEHIDVKKVHEVWLDEKPRDAYARLFGESVKQYNEQQKRTDRQITNYYKMVCEDVKKHPVYEMIIGVYGDENTEQCKEIMQQFVEEWKERNPNLEMIGAYYHADELGEPHVHIDYIPIAHNYTRGMKTQSGLVKAFEEMGFQKQGKITAQMQWQKRENQYLEELCNERGIQVTHPKDTVRRQIVGGANRTLF